MPQKKQKKIKEKQSREKDIPEYKIKLVQEITSKIKNHRTFLIASTKNLPSSQFHEIKKNLRGKVEIKVVKKNIAIRAIDEVKSAELDSLKTKIGSDIALFFSNEEPFTLSGILSESKSSSKAKAGDIAPEDINVEPGPTDLVPGPAISELSSVGLKVAVEGGKLAIKLPRTIVKKGEAIKDNVASVMAKLNIAPMLVGFEPIAAYDKQDDKTYIGIKIDKKATLENLRIFASKAFSFAVNIKHISRETMKYFIAKAGLEESVLLKKLNTQQPQGG